MYRWSTLFNLSIICWSSFQAAHGLNNICKTVCSLKGKTQGKKVHRAHTSANEAKFL